MENFAAVEQLVLVAELFAVRFGFGARIAGDDPVDAALTALADDERQIVLLHAVTGWKHREIAGLLELPLSTVLSKYRRALLKLKTKLEGGDAL